MAGAGRVRTKKMLLVATIGVGTVNYVACSSDDATSGNLVAPISDSGSGADQFASSGNLVAPRPDANTADTMSGSSSGGSRDSSGGGLPDSSSGGPQDSSSGGPQDSSSDGPTDSPIDRFIIIGNLIAPLPDAGND